MHVNRYWRSNQLSRHQDILVYGVKSTIEYFIENDTLFLIVFEYT